MENLKFFKDKILKYYNIDEETLEKLFLKEKELDEYWYKSGEKDLSFYEKIEYVAITYKTFELYSKTSCMCSKKFFTDDNYTILDYGAGIGLTTYLLSELYPNSTIIYQNLEGEQYNFAKHLLKDKKNVKFTYDIQECDIIFCLEFFEHIKEPIKMLNDFITIAKPKYLVVSNSFGSKSYGHYSEFKVGDKIFNNKKIGRQFGNHLRSFNYDKVKIFWNGRPTIWGK
jgi:2-polyprenyl-3-methyl-5-hydroxy-6-metoxy-1,4-benzoquinol methylase